MNSMHRTDIMTSDEQVAFMVRIGRKAAEELESLRLLHPNLNVKELHAKAYKAVLDHWVEFEGSRKILEAGLIELWFEQKYGFKEGHKDGGIEGEGDAEKK